MNLRPSGYEPDELPGCSIPRQEMHPFRRYTAHGQGLHQNYLRLPLTRSRFWPYIVPMMEITLNGIKTTLNAPVNITSFLNENGYSGKTVAVAVNGHFVPKSEHETHTVNADDDIEIVAPMQGG